VSDRIISKRDENGIIHVNNKRYKQRISSLYEELRHTQGFWNKLAVRMRIFDWKMAKAGAILYNGIIKSSRGVAKASGSISEISGQFGQSSDYSRNDYYYHLQAKNQKNRRNRRRKKHSKKQSEFENFFSDVDDYGFNMEDFFK